MHTVDTLLRAGQVVRIRAGSRYPDESGKPRVVRQDVPADYGEDYEARTSLLELAHWAVWPIDCIRTRDLEVVAESVDDYAAPGEGR